MTRVGLIGAGTIGRKILETVQASGAELAFVLVRDPARHADLGLPEGIVISSSGEALSRPVDLVIEAAMAEQVRDLAPRFLERADFCAFSTTAMADREAETAIRNACARHSRRFHVPHGAVVGLDGLSGGQDIIDSVTITTTKSGKSLGIDPETTGTVYEGSSRDACLKFPRNVNVHAAIALAGLGFDRTVSRIVAVPGQEENLHKIEVTGPGLEWELNICSRSLGGVTGAFTPQSAARSVQRILQGGGVVIA